MLEAQLPLGISDVFSCREMRWQLKPGDRLTFLSDGVLEARNESGELFGFDRTREISERTAQAIVDAARQFGQEDDITVMTVRFAPCI
jgi:serine phosphatase RsbU (regulator of sigma subunit)